MSGIIAVYSLVISVLIAQDLQPPASGSNYSLFKFVFHTPGSWRIMSMG
jgi:V-type H+-transporting ATPase proteolipid subunit